MQMLGKPTAASAEILTPEAMAFVAALQRKHNPRRKELLSLRAKRAVDLANGKQKLDFLDQTASVRDADWQVSDIPSDLQDRRVEITGPVERKMIINALNSAAQVFMADFEDSNAPTWDNIIEGQLNLRDAVRRTIHFSQKDGKEYKLNAKVATLFVRPRGWHLVDKHFLVDGEPISGSLLDFGLYLFHNHAELKRQKTGPYFYLPKLESHLEARLWNDVFVTAQALLGIPRGTIRATVLIETISAAFEMDEILYELKEHSAGLNCGRWDYIFSCIKKLGSDPHFVLADRALVTMTSPFMRAYSQLLIKTCHRRGVHAMGGMAAQIPIKNNPEANALALTKVRADKEREATDGHDGTWVAHPALVSVARESFDRHMPGPNQIHKKCENVHVTRDDLLRFEPREPITMAGLCLNVVVAIQYLGSWLSGTGCVPIFNLMEDAATAEICRSQVWQWVHSPLGVLDDGTKVDLNLVKEIVAEELPKIKAEHESDLTDNYTRAADLFLALVESSAFTEFLTLPAYEQIV